MKTKNGQNWPVIRWLLKAQIALTLVVALLTALLTNGNAGWFVILGGIAAMILTTIAAIRAFTVDAADDPKAALAALYRGLAAKIIGAVVFFVIIAKTMSQHLPLVVIGFAAATISYWIALLWAPLPAAAKVRSEEREDGKRDGR